MNRRIDIRENGGASFSGPDAVNVYAATVLASALKMYARSGMKASRFHTPKNMLAKASELTGKKYKGRDYLAVAEDLLAWAHSKAVTIHAEDDVAAGSKP